jgi:hypothetical protein
VLDLGCSTCDEGYALVGAGVDLVGVDRDAVTLAETAQRFASFMDAKRDALDPSNEHEELPKATFVACDAADFKLTDSQRFDLILLRRPDVAIQQEGWRAAFRKMPEWVAPKGQIIVTTPGAFEAKIAREWLQDLDLERIEERMISRKDEHYAVIARGVSAKDGKSNQKTLAEALAWEPDVVPMVCDLRTGKCSSVEPTNESDNLSVFNETPHSTQGAANDRR